MQFAQKRKRLDVTAARTDEMETVRGKLPRTTGQRPVLPSQELRGHRQRFLEHKSERATHFCL